MQLVFFNSFCDVFWRLVIIQFLFNKILQLCIIHNFLALEFCVFSFDIRLVMSFGRIILVINFVFVELVPNGVCAAAESVPDVCV